MVCKEEMFVKNLLGVRKWDIVIGNSVGVSKRTFFTLFSGYMTGPNISSF